MTAVLELRALSKCYGSLVAVDEVTLDVHPGERRAIIGPNGAGKTTLFNLIGGKVAPSGGQIVFRDEDITRWPEHRRARRGIAKTFQRSNVFGELSVRENVAVGVQRYAGHGRDLVRHVSRLQAVDRRTEELLGVTGLEDRQAVCAEDLSHGERRQLEIALALALEPTLLLLDEPAAGMSAEERERFARLVGGLPSGITTLLIEHDIELVFQLSTHVAVMAAGALLADGDPDEIAASPSVQEAYLGAQETEEIFLA